MADQTAALAPTPTGGTVPPPRRPHRIPAREFPAVQGIMMLGVLPLADSMVGFALASRPLARVRHLVGWPLRDAARAASGRARPAPLPAARPGP